MTFETPDWTIEEELMCIRILNEVLSGKCKVYRLR